MKFDENTRCRVQINTFDVWITPETLSILFTVYHNERANSETNIFGAHLLQSRTVRPLRTHFRTMDTAVICKKKTVIRSTSNSQAKARLCAKRLQTNLWTEWLWLPKIVWDTARFCFGLAQGVSTDKNFCLRNWWLKTRRKNKSTQCALCRKPAYNKFDRNELVSICIWGSSRFNELHFHSHPFKHPTVGHWVRRSRKSLFLLFVVRRFGAWGLRRTVLRGAKICAPSANALVQQHRKLI